MKVSFYYNKSYSIEANAARGFLKYLGLMFKTKNAKPLFFEFDSPDFHSIHSYFVNFDFLAVWLDEDYYIINVNYVKTWTPSDKPSREAKYLIEIPLIHEMARELSRDFEINIDNNY